MTATSPLVWLFGGVLVILVTGTVTGRSLRAVRGPSPVIDNLNARVAAWWVMVAVLALAFGFGRAGLVGLFALCSALALREFLTVAGWRRDDSLTVLAAFALVLPFQYVLVYIDWYGLYSIFIPVYAFLLMPVTAALLGQTDGYLARVAQVQWGLMVCVFCASHVPALLSLTIPGFEGRQMYLIAWLILVVQLSDVLQYVWGKLVGRRLIAPRLSPSKTWEGFVGGTLSASAVGTALWWVTPFAPWQAALLALLVTGMGFCGGLVLSAIKRDRGVKDWGHVIAGHGGVLDRLDSVFFAAPIFFHVVRYGWSST